MAKEPKEKPAPTCAEKFTAFVDTLAANGTISADVAGIVKHAIAHRAVELNG